MTLGRKALKKYFLESVSGPVKVKQVARALGIKDSEYGSLRNLMRQMAAEGVLRRVRKNCYTLAEGGDTVTGRVQLTRRGFGFIILDSGGRDFFVKSFNLGSAFDGDRVEVRVIHKSARGNPEAEVVRVINRARKRFVGILKKRKGFSVLEPAEDKVFSDILIPAGEAARLKNGQKLLVEVFDWGSGGSKPLGKVVEVLEGERANPEKQILLRYELPERFPSVVLRESREVPREVRPEDIENRRDLRRLTAFTIDPPDAQDFDDALSVKALPGGGFEVGVHIADVSHYVPEGSELDLEARERGLSVYLNHAYIPMLPEELSSGICSLTSGRDRLAMSVLIRLNPEGELKRSWIVPAVIRSRYRFDYEQAQRLIHGQGDASELDSETIKALRLLKDLSEKRRRRRRAQGQIDFDLPEPLVVKSDRGEPLEIRRKPRLESHRLVEEFMITANEIVAKRLAGSSFPALYRIHQAPDPHTVENINYQLKTLNPGLFISSSTNSHNPAAYSRVIDRAEELGLGELASLIVIQSMKRALYSIEDIGHFGLATGCYTHFTSPIRRYPDLLVHRLLKKSLTGEKALSKTLEYLEYELAGICALCSQREQLIESAERESDSLIQARFMHKYQGECFQGVITAVRSIGFSVRLEEYLVEGFVHASRLGNDFYQLDEKEACLKGKSSGRMFRLGQKLKLILQLSDPETGRIDFIPAELDETTTLKRKKKKATRRGKEKGRKFFLP